MNLKRKFDEFRYWLACRISPWVGDVDYRFSCVLCEVTHGMSKTNYTLDAMLSEIRQKRTDDFDMELDDYLADYEDEEILQRAKEVRERALRRRPAA